MTQSLAKYHARSPRYILQPQDNTLIRVAGSNQSCWEEGTEIKNISLSGLSFTAATELCPIAGEIIKIEFEVPGSKRMACYGLVSRLEPFHQTQMLVGIHFIKLEMPHRVALLQGLTQKIKEQDLDFSKTIIRNWHYSLLLLMIIFIWLSLFTLNLKGASAFLR